MKKKYLLYCFAFLLHFFSVIGTLSAQCTDGLGLVAFTGYQIADKTNPQGQQDQFSFVLLDYIPANTSLYFTDLGLTSTTAFQDIVNAKTDGVLKWTTSTALVAGTHIVIKVGGLIASSGTIEKIRGNFGFGLGGDQLFAYRQDNVPGSIEAALLINKASWDTAVGVTSSSKSVAPAIDAAKKQLKIVSSADEDAFQARWGSALTFTGNRAALRQQVAATNFTNFTSLNSDAVQLANLAITWNADAPTKSTIQKQDNQLSIVSNACYFQWQKSTDNVTFTDIEGADNSIYTLMPTTESTWYRVKLMGAQVIYSDSFTLGPALTTRPLVMVWNTELALLNINIVNVVGNTTRYTLSLQTTVGELAATGTADVSVSRANQNKNLTITGTGPDLNTFLARGAVKLIPSTDYYGNINVNLTLVEELTPTVNIASATTAVTVGRPPVLVAQNYSTFKNTTLTVAAADGLLKDVINLDGGTLQVQVVTGQTNGSLTLNTIDGSFTFTPIKDFVGEGSFSYKVSNGTLESAVTTSKILVKETAASVSTVSSPNLNKIFIAGDAVYIDVNFDKPIFVSKTAEGPKLKLRLDNNVTRTAVFQSAANRTVRFKYIVLAGDVASTKLNYYDVTSLTLEGASINNVSGVPSTITLPAIDAPGNLTGVPIRIDGTIPTGDFTINQGGTYTNTKNVKIFTSISDPNVNKLELSNDETVWTTVQAASAGIPWTLSDGDGAKLVYLRLTTAVGNKGLIVRSINLMTTAPVVSGVANNTVYNTDRTITFNKGTATLNGAAFTSGTVVKIDGGYVLVVTDDAGNTTIVNFEIDKTPPAKPTGLKAVFVAGTPDKVVISWNANTEFDLTGYRLNIDAGGANILNQTLGKTVTSYDLTGFEPGEELTIGLTAFDLPGNVSVAATLKFSPKFTQTINFAALNDAVYGTADRLLQATASSNLPVTFKTSDATKASVYQDAADGNAWKVKFLKAGEVDIIASQLGNDLYAAAPVVSRTLTITKANITGVTLPNASFIYDGTTKSLTTTGTLPTGVTIGTYTGNAKTDAGIHTVTVQLLGGDNYNNQKLTGTLTISKATIAGVTLADATYTYDGTAKSLTAAGILPTGATTGTYVGNAKTDAGTYPVTVTITGGTNYEDLALTATLTISKAQITGLTLPNATYTYDGIAKSLAVAGTLPTGVTVAGYTGNTKTNAGTYTVEATLAGGNNYIDKTLTGTLTINKAAISGLTLPNATYTYDGTAKSLAVAGTLPTGVTIDSYTGNGQTNAGEYDVEALVTGGVNYLDKTLTGTLTINKAEITGLTLADATYTYDGIAKSLTVAGTLPAGVTIAGYVGNGKINAGTYPVEANLVGGANYTDKTLTGTLTITKANITGVTLPDASYIYDGTDKSLVVTGALPIGVTVGAYTGNAKTNAGVYPVSVQLLGGNNYNNQTLTGTLTISKATITGVTLPDATYTYDGTAKSLATTGTLPSGATTGTYVGNAKTDAGIYPVAVTIVGGNNYQDLPLTATLTINKAQITGLTLPNASYIYDGTAKSLAVAGTLPTGVTVAAYTGNAKTNAGTYTVEAMLAGGNNYVDKTITGTLIIAKAALAGVTFQDASFTYDGKAKSLALIGSLPAGVTFSYVGNGKTEAGQYAVDAVIDGGNNYIGETQHATLTINKATLTGLSLPAARYTYDTSSKSLALVGTLPSGASVSYINNAQANAGLYAVQALVSGGNNYVDQTLTANLQIDKLDLSYLRLLDKTYVYDANTKSLAVDGLVPSFVTLTYDNNGQNKAGQYLVTATVVGTANYTAVSLKANLIIKKGPQKILAVNVPATLSRDAGNIPVEVRSVSGLPVFLKVDDPMVATVKDHRLEVLRLGTVVITATQPGNENYEAAEPLSVTVRVVAAPDAQIPIIVNQALSPNGDGINDFLIMEGIKDFPQNKVTIFDKAGTVLQVIEGYNNVDRVFTGDRQTDGTYFYYIDVKDGNQWKRQKGFFVLKRSAR